MDAVVEGAGADLVYGRVAGEGEGEAAVGWGGVAALAPLDVCRGLAGVAGYG